MEPHQEIYKYLSPFLVGLLLSTGIGLIIGLEREYTKLQGGGISGIRTFPIVCIAGFLLANLSGYYSDWILVSSVPAFLIFLGFDHFTREENHFQGHTTHVALFVAFLLGMMISEHLYKEGLAVAVIVVTLLTLKDKFKTTLKRITQQELYATIKFFILSLLILPFLPDQDFGPDGILNAYTIGWVVVIVSLLNFIGYFLVKFIGSGKGVLLTAVLGGLISSTAVAWAFAPRGKENPTLAGTYAAGIVISSAIMFPRLALVAFIFNPAMITHLWLPFTLMFVTALIFSWWMSQKNQSQEPTQEIQIGNPLDIFSALSFALVFVVILLVVYYAGLYYGNGGLYLSAIISGLADTDAITISMAKLAIETVKPETAAMIIVTATLSNTLVKMLLSIWKGGRVLGGKVAIAFGSVLLIGTLYVVSNQILR